jgi:NAD(P)-dependent dehydrogenase (short-subunit alcohol dehydrogenase family)
MNNKIILITGAANGIGRSLAEYLLSKGDIVIPTDIDADGLRYFKKIENAFPVVMNVANMESIQTAVHQTQENFGHIDCIVNNAGIFLGGPIVEVEMEEFEKIININILGYIRVVKAFYLLLKSGSRIINVTSEVGRIAWPFNGPYTVTKYATEGFNDSLRRELLFKDIKVIKIQPGSINTAMMDCTKESYEKYCEDSEFENEMKRVFGVLAREGYADPINMAKTVYKAIHNKHTKLVYRVKNHPGRRISEFIPARWLDSILKKWI